MTRAASLDVSRETKERLNLYAALLKKWNSSINLVAKSTLPDLWTRHMLDSLQLYHYARHPVGHWADLGTGGGFPGLVIAVIAEERRSPARITLVESDHRKCAFLRTALRETGVQADVLCDRVENIPSLDADVVSARALADLTKLLQCAQQHLHPDGTALFQKGVSWQRELAEAQKTWYFHETIATSKTAQGGVVMQIRGISRA